MADDAYHDLAQWRIYCPGYLLAIQIADRIAKRKAPGAKGFVTVDGRKYRYELRTKPERKEQGAG